MAASEQADDQAKLQKELGETEAIVRGEHTWAGKILFWVGVGISAFHVWQNTFGTMSELWFSATHFGMLGFFVALMYPAWHARHKGGQTFVAVIDVIVGALVVLSALYLMFAEKALYDRGVNFVTSDWVISILAIGLAIELARRTTGWIIPSLILISLTYVSWWGQYVGGIFQFPGLTWETLLFRSYFGGDGMFGSIARISATYVFMFILFGAFLVRSGAGDFIINLAKAAAGRFVGGPGLVAVFGSSLMGSISGSAVANTVSTGVITIPLMTKAGFKPRFAAGVEASASTGGQLMPPIMGAGAFIMASYTQIPYLDIIAVSALPAFMYFLSIAFWVRIEAKRLGIQAAEDPDAKPTKEILRTDGYLLIPIFVLVGLLIYGFTPTYAAGISILSVIAASWLGKNKMGPRAIIEALALGARNMASTGVLLVAVGLIVNVIGTTGIGNTFSLMITDWAGGSLIITIVLIALASLVLGMGLPVTAAYIVLGTLSAPALYGLIVESHLVEMIASGQIADQAKAIFMLVAPDQLAQLGQPMSVDAARDLLAKVPDEMTSTVQSAMISPAILSAALLSAHMIIFWLSQDSNVTPPVCLTAFAAAAIAGTPPMKTGFMAWKIAKGLYIVPLLFAYTPFLYGDIVEASRIFFFGTFGIYALTASVEGYMEAPLSWPMRGLSAFAGVVLLWPLEIWWEIPALVFLGGLLALNIRNARKNPDAPQPT